MSLRQYPSSGVGGGTNPIADTTAQGSHFYKSSGSESFGMNSRGDQLGSSIVAAAAAAAAPDGGDKHVEFNDLNRIGLQKKKGHIYKIEEAVLPSDFSTLYTPLPLQVEFKRIVQNIMNARQIKKEEWGKEVNHSESTVQGMYGGGAGTFITNTQVPERRRSSSCNRPAGIQMRKRESEYDRWHRYLSLEENLAIVSDSFWFAISKFQEKQLYRFLPPDEVKIEERRFKGIQEKLLNRIARNYVNILLSIENKNDNNMFFKKYFDIVAQAVFYSFFYAFPKSRSQFSNELKAELINEFSFLFTGIHITNSFKYWSQWNLDLGAGNILTVEDKKNTDKPIGQTARHRAVSMTVGSSSMDSTNTSLSKTDVIPLPALPKDGQNLKNKRTLMPIKFSPILDKYIHTYNYQTKNYVAGFKMKFTQSDSNKEAVESKFKTYLAIADQIREKSDQMIVQNNASTKRMKEEIKKLKNETMKHHRRLEKRKQEELERGAHEYANYLVSMLDAGLPRGNIGVVNQKNAQ